MRNAHCIMLIVYKGLSIVCQVQMHSGPFLGTPQSVLPIMLSCAKFMIYPLCARVQNCA